MEKSLILLIQLIGVMIVGLPLIAFVKGLAFYTMKEDRVAFGFLGCIGNGFSITYRFHENKWVVLGAYLSAIFFSWCLFVLDISF
ncbi:MAG: hypothetical protein AAB432_01395 [Patescibacteria group bacterium]